MKSLNKLTYEELIENTVTNNLGFASVRSTYTTPSTNNPSENLSIHLLALETPHTVRAFKPLISIADSESDSVVKEAQYCNLDLPPPYIEFNLSDAKQMLKDMNEFEANGGTSQQYLNNLNTTHKKPMSFRHSLMRTRPR